MGNDELQTRQIENPVFMIGVPRSGTSVISEVLSLHADLAWISNYLNFFPV